eukprot:759319-Hanusia_phi.AAC.2
MKERTQGKETVRGDEEKRRRRKREENQSVRQQAQGIAYGLIERERLVEVGRDGELEVAVVSELFLSMERRMFLPCPVRTRSRSSLAFPFRCISMQMDRSRSPENFPSCTATLAVRAQCPLRRCEANRSHTRASMSICNNTLRIPTECHGLSTGQICSPGRNRHQTFVESNQYNAKLWLFWVSPAV